MSSFIDLARSRRSCRVYDNRPIARKDLELCAEAARYAPSACNSQPWKFVIIDDPTRVREVADTFPVSGSMNAFAKSAPAFMAIVSERQKTIPWLAGKLAARDFRLMDLGIACAHIVLEAEELGIGTCILGWFDQKKLGKILGLPAGKKIELVISIGYPPEGWAGSDGKNIKERSETVSFNRY